MKSKILKSGLYGAAVVVVGLGVLLMTRHSNAQISGADNAGLPTASVAQVIRQDLFKEVSIAAEFRPYEEVELHAKVSGYLKDMNVDFGDTVKAGEVLANLEVPELQDDLHNAIAAEEKAEADYTNADLIYTRLMGVNRDHPNLVAQQDLDTALANDQAAAAAAAAAKANADKYQTLIGYTTITAPFDGVVTRRYADPGALIQAGTSSDTQSLPLVRVSDNYRLRLDFPVTVDYVKDIQLGDTVDVNVESLSESFTGKICRFTHDVNEDTRTMITEIEVPNPKLEIVPGMYATVALKVEKRPHTLVVPVEAVVGGATPSVFIVNGNNQLEEQPVKLGLETPDKYEVLSGLKEGDLVLIGDHSGFQPGEKVQPKIVQLSMLDNN